MNKVKAGTNMYQNLNDYPVVNSNRGYTWNTIKGQCPEHDCLYCYMRVFKLAPRRFDNSELKTDLGTGNFIFVGSSNDMFAETIPRKWIEDTLSHCQKFQNRYLFQSKNPQRFQDFMVFPSNSILATTIESNRDYGISKAPSTLERKLAMEKLSLPKMITIEPVLDFDLDVMVRWMQDIGPEWINVGADSKNHNLPEPSWEKVERLIQELGDFTVIRKTNLERLHAEGKKEVKK